MSAPKTLVIEKIRIDSTHFETGDVVLRRGTNIVSDMIAKAFPKARGMSHCGILVEEDGAWQVVHTISGRISDIDGIRKCKIEDFALGAKNGEIIHVKPLFNLDRDMLVSVLTMYLNNQIQFDHEFNLDDDSRMYCSELVRSAYLEAGANDVFLYKRVGHKSVIDMSSFFQEELFR